MIGFTALAQGLLTNKYLNGVPDGSRAAAGSSLDAASITPAVVEQLRALDDIASARGQSLAQMALAWVLRDPRVTSLVIAIDEHSVTTADVDVWAAARKGEI
ncbi:aldo/keto reductase [Rhodococcus opacus]|nr:aldo/keto reductase [Rhodococcus opacus]